MCLIFKCDFLWKADCTNQILFMMVFPSGTHFSAESTEAMQIKCFAQEFNVPMQPRFEPLITASRERHVTDMTIMFFYMHPSYLVLVILYM